MMTNGRNKYQSRENRNRVREILRRDWDPIGVGEIPEAADEYNGYADRACLMLIEGRSADDIENFLVQSPIELMGLSNSGSLEEKSREVAKLLVAIRPQMQLH